jgi:hypothetical protein
MDNIAAFETDETRHDLFTDNLRKIYMIEAFGDEDVISAPARRGRSAIDFTYIAH